MRLALIVAVFAPFIGNVAHADEFQGFSPVDAIRLHPEARLFAGGLGEIRRTGAPAGVAAGRDEESSMLGLDVRLGGGAMGLRPFLGATIGLAREDGERAVIGGPTLGLSLGEGIEARLSYEFAEDREAEAGTVTLGISFLNF